MFYYKLVFACVHLPLALIIYQLVAKKYRWMILLLASITFYATFSLSRMIYPLSAAAIAYGAGLLLDMLIKKQDDALALVTGDKDEIRTGKAAVRKKYTAKQRAVLAVSICVLILIILNVKYTGFAIENLNALLSFLGIERQYSYRSFVLPLGISFYTLQAIGYLVDIYWKKIPAQKNPAKLLLFIMFFPTIIEGPITPYNGVYKNLYEGNPVDPDNIVKGYFRLGWGAMKKLVIADRLYPVVCWLFYKPNDIHGLQVIAAAVLYTIMEYMDFSGCIDMAIGSANMFGIILPENFRQPFLAKSASEFWRRWHISLGVWFKTYIFYPVSMSSLAKKWAKFARGKVSVNTTKAVASAMALLPVWLCNGLWHGPEWKYIFYGIFYFVVILFEVSTEPLFNVFYSGLRGGKDGKAMSVLRVLKTWVIIFVGELFFEAGSVRDGFAFLKALFRDFDPGILWDGSILDWGMDLADWVIVIICLIVIATVNLLREGGTDIGAALLARPAALRWSLGLLLLMTILILGLYGPGFLEVNTIYAGF